MAIFFSGNPRFRLLFRCAMALRHAIFVKCYEHCDDPHMADIFFGLAHGLMPFCVTEDINQGTLYFRRSFGPTEKDKVCFFFRSYLFFFYPVYFFLSP